MAYYCTRQTGRKDENGNREECAGEIKDGECTVCGAKY